MLSEKTAELFGAFRCFRKIAKSHICLSVCLSFGPQGTTKLPLDGIFVKFDIWGFLENLSKELKFL
jgi:hypothetical protein